MVIEIQSNGIGEAPTMGEDPTTTQSNQQNSLSPSAATASTTSQKKLTLIPLIFIIYFEVAGGPYGEEPAVKAAGPLFAILGFLIFPFIWSIPEALITAELSTAFPGNGGYVIWADQAFGPFWGSLLGNLKFLSGVLNLPALVVLGVDYVKLVFPIFDSGLPRYLAILLSTLLLSFLNYTGLAIVGYAAVVLGIVSLCPFILMSLIAIPKIKPHRWLSLGQKGVKKDWSLYCNTLFWNLNFWDSVSTLAGEVDKPQKIFPRALFAAVTLTCLAYLFPLLAVTGSVVVDQDLWDSGFHADAAKIIAGKWLKFWIEVGAVLSAIGLFEASLSSGVYQLEGMANLGFLPKFFAKRSKWFKTPWVGILVSTSVGIGVSFMSFTDIISSANFVYSAGMLLEFASFLWLRRKRPLMKRPYKVPLKMPGLIILCLIPSAFLILVMAIATKIVYLVSGLMIVGGIGFYFFMNFCKSKQLLKFATREEVEEGEG